MRRQIAGWLYRLYNRQIVRELAPSDRIPRHVGVITDGNRRWAKEFGATTEQGHRAGAQKIVEFLGWCDEIGIEVVTLYVLSRENLQRTPDEVEALVAIISDMVEQIAQSDTYAVNLVGDLSVLPEPLRARLEKAQESSRGGQPSVHVNVAVGYGGRQEIVNAIKSYLRAESAAGTSMEDAINALTEESLAEHLYTKGQPDPDLIIRSSGEQRLSGFLIWQSAYSEFFFCEAYWPAFRKTDFLRAVRDYSQRQRRYGK
ncbi:isoprenyl transferase [Brevibacterium sp. UMB10442]|uniref:isoprenyl transferase n=1 Tax=Brevibacterium sp. UMB1308A TaxID=3050608 RepID=UPI00254D44AD|nr:isoprenyl transferase [Brevibacterium sp. UMB1308A]MDK7748859.1 isoprenyl transferase [Brevibacterium sp. UMB10442]MDK8345772.1 isoprenyl transferase [Brevibacterium sp. UMB1308B]MDK8712768.1 isoprenyl transferase [Brevibacterium sp. UMB1308A]